MASAQQYSLVFTNNSRHAWNACLYQSAPDPANYEVFTLAWLTKAVAPTTSATFQWTLDYSFVWDETGRLEGGVVFDASQTWPATLTGQNAVTLTHVDTPSSDYYTFTELTAGPAQGSLYIYTDSTVPVGAAAVGIAMSGAATFVTQAQPNLNLEFTPSPAYWITFGRLVQGEVIDLTEITNSAGIAFPPGVFTMYATLNEDNTWTVSPERI